MCMLCSEKASVFVLTEELFSDVFFFKFYHVLGLSDGVGN